MVTRCAVHCARLYRVGRLTAGMRTKPEARIKGGGFHLNFDLLTCCTQTPELQGRPVSYVVPMALPAGHYETLGYNWPHPWCTFAYQQVR